MRNPFKTIWFITLFLLTFFLFPTFSFSEDSIAWVAHYGSPGGGENELTGVFIDSSGKSIYVAGSSEGTITHSDIFLMKIDSLGQQLWVRTYNGPGNTDDDPIATIMDINGNI